MQHKPQEEDGDHKERQRYSHPPKYIPCENQLHIRKPPSVATVTMLFVTVIQRGNAVKRTKQQFSKDGDKGVAMGSCSSMVGR